MAVASLLVLCTVLAGQQSGDDSLESRLREATRYVDRVIVTPPEGGYPDDDTEPDAALFEVTGRAAIETLISVMVFEHPPEGVELPCHCYGTHRLQFFSGNNFKFLLSYHHWNRLRGDFGGPWGGDAVLTDLGRQRFMQWFSDHGFPEFAQGLAREEDRRKAAQAKQAEIASLFPVQAQTWIPKIDTNPSWNSEDDVRSVELAALFPNKVELLLTCWRTLGIMAKWPHESALRVYGEPGGFVLKALEAAKAEDIREALRTTPPSDVHAQLGSLRHLASLRPTDPNVASWQREWQIKLARFYLQHGPSDHLDGLVALLTEMNNPDADDLLLDIGSMAVPKPDPVVEDGFVSFPESPEVLALFKLAQRRHPHARDLIQEKLRGAPEGEDRWTLEVALACYELTPSIRAQHLLSEMDFGRVAEVAWKLICPEQNTPVDISLLTAAAGSPNYKVKEQASERLAALGLQRLEIKAEKSGDSKIIDPQLTGRPAIDACTISLAAKPVQANRTELLKRRGIEYLKLGDFEPALRDLRAAYRAAPYEHAFAAFCLGRDGEAMDVVFRARRGESAEDFLRLRGCVYYAMNRFQEAADEFTAAQALGGGRYNLVFRHMSLLHLDRGADSPLRHWEPVFAPEKETWPEALFFWLKGEVSDEAMLAIALAGKGRDSADDRSFAYWVLAEMARLKGDVTQERKHLKACMDVQAFTSLTHALALRRSQALDEQDRFSSAQ